MILRQDDDNNYIEINDNGYTLHISGWYAGGFSYTRAVREGAKRGVAPDNWAIMEYNRIRLQEARMEARASCRAALA